jgi:hypothetical protein
VAGLLYRRIVGARGLHSGLTRNADYPALVLGPEGLAWRVVELQRRAPAQDG